jgi:tight adherence protein C
LAYRCHVNSVTKFVNAINQSEKYGTSVSKVLKSQSDFVRETLKNEGEEKVQTAQSKLIIPLVIFALPAIFIILLGPAALEFFA